jgi:hypothetical protein
MELNSFGSRNQFLHRRLHYYVFSQLAKKAINWHEETKVRKRNEGKEISSLLMGKQRTRELCVYSHLFVLSRFQAPHMDRCFPFHSSELELDVEICCLAQFVFSLGPGDYMAML